MANKRILTRGKEDPLDRLRDGEALKMGPGPVWGKMGLASGFVENGGCVALRSIEG